MSEFVHLHTHSEFSLVDSILTVEQIAAFAAREGASAVALTDRNNLYGAVKFYKKARALGVKPIIGCDLTVRAADEESTYRLVLLAMNREGFVHLCELVSFAYEEDQRHGVIAVDEKRLTAAQCTGLIALSGALEGDVGQCIVAQRMEEAEARIRHWQQIFADRFYLQIARHGKAGEAAYLSACETLGHKLGVAAVATNLACFEQPDDFPIHETRVCISGGYLLDDTRRPRDFTTEHHLKSHATMASRFADTPQLIANAGEIAKRCNLELELGKNYLPDFPIPEGQTIEEHLGARSHEGLSARLLQLFPDDAQRAEKEGEYRARLDVEIGVINSMGFPGYFLIVADFIQWAKDHDIPVGPGRGSGAGSLVAYALGITDLDPLAYDLLFERFLNPERVSMPDFDVDFCMDKRDRVIAYVADKYGHDKVSQIATHGTMAAKAVVRDVGRVMGLSYSFCDRISKMIPAKPLGTSLSDALGRSKKSAEEPERVSTALIEQYGNDEDTKQLIDTALRLEGLARNVGKHAGGVVIAPTRLTDFSAIYAESAGASLSTQFDKDDIEAVGLVKFDFLGLRTLTVIDWALAHVNKRRAAQGEAPLSMNDVPLDDPATFRLLKACQTTAVFQLESSGMKNLIKKLQPDNFEDIIALVALFRPGPLQSGMVDDFIARKHGLADVVYPHPALEPILRTTYGVMVYQEQVMQVAQVLAKYTLGGADELRRAMGKKKAEEMARHRGIFVDGATKNDVNEKLAGDIFDLMAKFAEYGFNKSHSAAYALLSYHTAWLKAHYPAEFMAAVLSSEMEHTDKLVRVIDECFDMGLTIRPPCINRSDYAFTVENGEIIYGLGAVKGVGEAAIGRLLDERKRRGAFTSLTHLCERMDIKKLNKKTLETLIRAGAFDQIEANRGGLFAALPQAFKLAEQHHKNQSSQQGDMFGLFGGDNYQPDATLVIKAEDAWEKREQLEYEKETLGLFLTDHPVNAVRHELLAMSSHTLAEVHENFEKWEKPRRRDDGMEMTIGGLVVDIRIINSKKDGSPMAFVTLDDRSGRIEFGVFGEDVGKYRDQLKMDTVLIAKVKASYAFFRDEWRLGLLELHDIDTARIQLLRELRIHAEETQLEAQALTDLQQLLATCKDDNGARLMLHLQLPSIAAKGDLRIPGHYRFGGEQLGALKARFGDSRISLHY
ncbi:MAG: DNA polymerase III subunit alpha [Cardiobacteriaceae bacterium]|nr:DNA polymerase III subunit alpha [Cardiobacteriaceae bacterium]